MAPGRDLETWIPGVRIGWLQGKWNATKRRRGDTIKHTDSCPDDIHDCSVVIASIESLSQCEYPEDILYSFGLVIIDEMHVLAAKTLVHVLPKLPAAKLVGLTATPDRKDGLEKVLYWLVGPTSFVFKRLPHITGVTGSVEIHKRSIPACISPIYNENGIDFTSTTLALSTNIQRMKRIEHEIIELLKIRKKVLVITSFVQHGHDILALPIDVEKYFLY